MDVGAGTTDFFVFDYHDQKITPIIKDGMMKLGGNDYTEALTSHIKEKARFQEISSPDRKSRF